MHFRFGPPPVPANAVPPLISRFLGDDTIQAAWTFCWLDGVKTGVVLVLALIVVARVMAYFIDFTRESYATTTSPAPGPAFGPDPPNRLLSEQRDRYQPPELSWPNGVGPYFRRSPRSE